MAVQATIDYCTVADLQNRLSANGVSLRIDDTPPTVLGDVISEASITIDEAAFNQYTQENLATSAWVRHRAIDLAVLFLCERRGNAVPASILRRYERALSTLDEVRTGNRYIYDISQRRTAAPTMSNIRPVMRPYNRSVVENSTRRSTGVVTSYVQNRDIWSQMQDGFLDWSF